MTKPSLLSTLSECYWIARFLQNNMSEIDANTSHALWYFQFIDLERLRDDLAFQFMECLLSEDGKQSLENFDLHSYNKQ